MKRSREMKSFFRFGGTPAYPHIFGRRRHSGLIMVEVPPCKDIDEGRITCNVSNQSGHDTNRQLLPPLLQSVCTKQQYPLHTRRYTCLRFIIKPSLWLRFAWANWTFANKPINIISVIQRIFRFAVAFCMIFLRAHVASKTTTAPDAELPQWHDASGSTGIVKWATFVFDV